MNTWFPQIFATDYRVTIYYSNIFEFITIAFHYIKVLLGKYYYDGLKF